MRRLNLNIAIDARCIQDHFPGIGRYTYNLIQGLAYVSPGQTFVLLHNPALLNTRHDVGNLTRFPNMRLMEVDVPTFCLAEQYHLPFTICHPSFTILHSPYYIKPYLLPCSSVVTFYDLIPSLYPAYFSPTQRLIFHIAHALALRTADAAIAISEATRRDLIHYFNVDPDKISTIPLAAGSRFHPQPPEIIVTFRRTHDLPDRYILYFGSNKPHKNLVRLIEAFSRITDHAFTMRHSLVIAGHWDPRYPEPRQRAEEIGITDRVVFLGPVPDQDLPALYSGAALFVFPSLYEGFGLPPLEAMACGTPVICSNTSSFPEVVGEAAIMIDPFDVEGLAAAMGHVLGDGDLQAEMREKALKQAAKFSWEETARQTLKVYKAVADS